MGFVDSYLAIQLLMELYELLLSNVNILPSSHMLQIWWPRNSLNLRELQSKGVKYDPSNDFYIVVIYRFIRIRMLTCVTIIIESVH